MEKERERTMYKYIFLDVDGTLYSPLAGETPQSAIEALKKARENGYKIFLCTGRSLAEAKSYLHYDVDGFIFGAGGMIYAERKRIYDHPIKKEDVTMIKEMIRSSGMGFSLEGSAGAYCSKEGYEAVLWYYSGGVTDRKIRIQKAQANCMYEEEYGDESNDAIYKICAFGKRWEEDYPALRKQLPAPYVLTKSMEIPHENFCIGEVSDGTITKKTGIEKILEYYHASKEEAVGIGDSENDIPMFEACGLGIAMGNGTSGIKAKADYITTDILDNGLYNAFVYAGIIDED